ncbi:MAG: glycosyl transferase [Sphingobium sp.]|nr:MAG: glycosyl transferase [Sphingobium sp.]
MDQKRHSGVTGGHATWEPRNDHAVIIHIWHMDVVQELKRHAAFLGSEADQFVTFADTLAPEKRLYIKSAFPKAQLLPIKNIGQDIGALFQLMQIVDLSRYDFICKIHTKKGNKRAAEWRKALLDGVLHSPTQVDEIVQAFRTDRDIVLAGTRSLFLYGPLNLFGNVKNIGRIFSASIAGFDFQREDWGFFGGSCFWIRRSILDQLALCAIDFEESGYVDDGLAAHATERMFGMMATLTGGKTLLSDIRPMKPQLSVVAGFPADLPRETVSIDRTLTQLAIATADIRNFPLRGSLDLHPGAAAIKGWLAAIGDPCPRHVLVRCKGIEIRAYAAVFRQDLIDNGINEGVHSFHVNLPHALMDGNDHEFTLIDAATGREVTRSHCRWNPPARTYNNFHEFLCSSFIQPMIYAPFLEEDKRSFATMENIADRLCKRAQALSRPPLVSIIMPVYNRVDIVADAILSALSQSYEHIELIVVDDGSSDGSAKVARSFTDPRVRAITLLGNQGQCKARNIGVDLSHGEIITYLDSDNLWDTRYVAAIVGAFAELPKTDAIATGQFLFRGNDSAPFAARYGHLNRALLENNNYIDINCVAHRRDVTINIGGFNEELRRYVDFDFILRLMDEGELVTVPVMLCHYHFDRAANRVSRINDRPHDLTALRKGQTERSQARLARLDQQELSHPVTVIIPNWQSLDDLQACIAALHNRDWQGMLDIIVVDNGSDQPVVDWLRRQATAGLLRLIDNDENYGFSHAVNQGIAASRPASDLLLLNNDAVIRPGAVQALQKAAFDLPQAGITVPRQILPAASKTIGLHVPYADPSHEVDVNVSAHHRNMVVTNIYHDGGPIELTFAPFFATYIRRPVVEAIGMLDAEFGRHYRSDRIYCDLMRNVTGMKIYYVPDAHILHKLQQATQTLKSGGADNMTFQLMFHRNQWSAEHRARLGYRNPIWDLG